MSTRQDYLIAIDSFVGAGELPLGTADKLIAISQAVKIHSKYNPKQYVVDITGLGLNYFDYLISTYLTNWADDFSSIINIEYPLDDTTANLDIVPKKNWLIYEKTDGKYIRFLVDVPSTSETIRVWYTGLYICTDIISNISTYDEEAVQMLASSIFCTMLATVYAETQDNTISADSIDHANKAKEYSIRSKIYKNMYFEHLGSKNINLG